MMKKFFLIFSLTFILAMQVWGARAYPHPRTYVQPDGSSITLIGHGDEFSHYVTTSDGYTVVKGKDGFYRYAVREDGKLKASEVVAKEIDRRTTDEKEFVRTLQRHLKPAVSPTGRKLMKRSGKTDSPFFQTSSKVCQKRALTDSPVPDKDYRGLVILVNFTDRKFTRGTSARQLVDDMMNKPDYTYYDDPLLQGRIKCTGSVRDYFNDNSNGSFHTGFDVFGPIEIDEDQFYINGTERTYELCRKVLETADKEIDYSDYDLDGDGAVDMFYILYAGYSSVYQGNDERLIWPHAGHFEDYEEEIVLDGVKFGRFACSAELFGWESDKDLFLDGIGVIVHEFSHILGFKDHYDVSGYLNEDPGTWDIMASGNYNGLLNDTPCGFNSYEKYAAGFLKPKTIENVETPSISLRPLSSWDDAIRIRSMQDSTIFLLENRQLEKWDKYLPGHGMLVWRVDSCDNEYWEHNALNVNGRLHFKLIRADGPSVSLFKEIEDMDHDPFPGSRNVCELDNYGLKSNMLTDHNYPSPIVLRDIREEDGIIGFNVEEDPFASDKPYTFSLWEKYAATGVNEENERVKWMVRTDIVESGLSQRLMIYDLVPYTGKIALTDPKYSSGLGASYYIGADRKKIFIEPYRVAVTEDTGIWLVDFNDLDNGGSGGITLNMTPGGALSLYNPDSVLGYCVLPRKSAVVTPESIMERLSMFREVEFEGISGLELITFDKTGFNGKTIFNLQGIPVENPRRGEIYIVNGKKIIY